MAKPTNFNQDNCESTSSKCVIWDGPNITCIDLCNGDSISDVTYKLAVELCTIMDQLNISNYDLKCLQNSGCNVLDFKSFINILITKVCAIEASVASGAAASSANPISSTSSNDFIAQNNDCPNCYVELAPCFRYNDPASGDLVTNSLVQDYVKRIAVQVCSLITAIETQNNINISFNTRITGVENAVANLQPYTLPNLYPTCIGDTTELLSLDDFAKLLEQQFCTLRNALGDATDIYNTIATPPSDMNTRPALGTGGGTMGSQDGWVQDPQNLSDSVTNLWIFSLDLYSAIRNIQLNCCNTTCDGIELQMSATLENKILKLYFTGTIPENLDSCVAGGSIFKIEDDSGNFINTTVDIKNNLNNESGVSIDLNSTPLNFADDLDVSSVFCFRDIETGSMCQNYIAKVVNNNFNCPTLSLTSGLTSVNFSFNHSSGTLTYYVQLFNSVNVMVQSQSFSVDGPTVIAGLFSGLTSDTAYKIRVQIVTASNVKTCPFNPFNTLPNPCPAPTGVSVIFS